MLLSHKKDEIMSFAAIQMDLEIFILSEVSQTKTDSIWYHLYMESLKNELIYKTKIDSTDFANKLMVTKWKRWRGIS